MKALKTLKAPKSLKTRRTLLLIALVVAVVASSGAIYFLFFYSPLLSPAETAGRIESIYNRASVILSLVSDDIEALSTGNITLTAFADRVTTHRTDLMSLRTEIVELQAAANQEFLTSIDLLDRGLRDYVTALDYASEFDLESTAQYLVEGTNYVEQSRDALPTFT
jgi:hypothetical protein